MWQCKSCGRIWDNQLPEYNDYCIYCGEYNTIKRSVMIQVSEFKTNVTNEYGHYVASLFMDELEKWDNTVTRSELYGMFYNPSVLEMLLNNILQQ
jgi:hypothetical protein